MRLIDMKCPACGGIIGRKPASDIATCEYCGSLIFFDDDEPGEFQGDDAYGEDSPLSMVDYAEKACADFLADFDSNSFREAPKIVRGLGICDGDRIFLIHDDTFMKSGKNGFAVTDRGLYCREMSEQATFMDWQTFAGLKQPDLDGCYIKCANRSVCYFTDDSDLLPELLKLYHRMHWHATRHA